VDEDDVVSTISHGAHAIVAKRHTHVGRKACVEEVQDLFLFEKSVKLIAIENDVIAFFGFGFGDDAAVVDDILETLIVWVFGTRPIFIFACL